MLKLSTICWISAFNARGFRGIIVAVQLGAVKIYVAALEALRTDFLWWFSEFQPPLNANVLFGTFLNLTLCMTNLRVLVLSFPDFTDIFNIWHPSRPDVPLDGKVQKELHTIVLHRTKQKELGSGKSSPRLLSISQYSYRWCSSMDGLLIYEQTQKSQLTADIISVD
jgi:hypothetical protein